MALFLLFSATQGFNPSWGVSEACTQTLFGIFCAPGWWNISKVPWWVWEVSCSYSTRLSLAKAECDIWILIAEEFKWKMPKLCHSLTLSFPYSEIVTLPTPISKNQGLEERCEWWFCRANLLYQVFKELITEWNLIAILPDACPSQCFLDKGNVPLICVFLWQ